MSTEVNPAMFEGSFEGYWRCLSEMFFFFNYTQFRSVRFVLFFSRVFADYCFISVEVRYSDARNIFVRQWARKKAI